MCQLALNNSAVLLVLPGDMAAALNLQSQERKQKLGHRIASWFEAGGGDQHQSAARRTPLIHSRSRIGVLPDATSNRVSMRKWGSMS